MQHIIRAFAGGDAGVQILDIALREGVVGVVQKQLHVFRLASGKIVETAYPEAHVQQCFAKVCADKARPAGDEKNGIFGKIQLCVVHYNLQYR